MRKRSEDLRCENRHDLIPVTGQALLDESGFPKQIIAVNDIRDLDMSPLVIDTVSHSGLTLKASAPLVLELTTDSSRQWVCIEQADLGIDVFALTREALLTELAEQIVMLWQEYALAADKTLDVEARRLKFALLEKFAETTNAA